jgi:hypothetical protein
MLIASDAPKGSRAKRDGQSPAFGDRHTTLFPQYLCKANLNLATGVAISVCMYSIYAIGFSLSSAKS